MQYNIITFIIGQAITLLGIGIGAYLKIMTRLKEFEIRIAHVEKQDESIIKKLDRIDESLTEIKVKLEGKQNIHQ